MYKKNRIHFVGIGGVGMSGIAEVLLNLGYPVSGSDLKLSNAIRRLRKRGAAISLGHRRQNVKNADIVVFSSAIKRGNPEIEEAHERKIPVVGRAEMLAELMRFSKFGIAVAGTHGKTTTTSLIAALLHAGGHDPTMIIGGRVNSIRSNARLGKGDFMVAEADESDGSFLKLAPTLAVITNIDREHMDYYKNLSSVKQAFLEFAEKVPFYGAVVACRDHPVVRGLIPQIAKRVVPYGLSNGSAISARNITYHGAKTRYDLLLDGHLRGSIQLNLPGMHNVLNSLAAIGIAHELGIPLSKIRKALKGFRGIQRRCEVLLKNENFTVIDDYGHHPQEIIKTLDAIRQAYTGRLVTLFQPHRYTRTRDLFRDFASAFGRSDIVLVTDIYAASEQPIRGVNAKKLAHMIKKRRKRGVYYLPRGSNMATDVLAHLKRGDILLSLGAGDVTSIGRECAKRLRCQ